MSFNSCTMNKYHDIDTFSESDSGSESDIESESDDDSEEIKYTDDHIANILSQDIFYKHNNPVFIDRYYYLNLSTDELHKINIWIGNRKINKKHTKETKKKLLKNLKETENKEYATDMLNVGVYINHNNKPTYELLDGQHRYKALLEIKKQYKKNKLILPPIQVKLNFCKNKEELQELYYKINNRMALTKKDIINEKVIKLGYILKSKFKKEIFGMKRPRINKDYFNKKAKDIDYDKYTIDTIVKYVLKINERNLKNLKNMDISQSTKDRMKKSGCALAVNSKCEYLDKFLKNTKKIDL